ncbi:MAG: CoA transferase [Armatimonadetes bacterium]|nr:CoA transferase [Armatimonadota bacterium]
MFQPLGDIRVLDLTRVLAGPSCTQHLADLGAEVWKVESMVGDETRQWGPPSVDVDGEAMSAYYLCANRGKKSICIDLKQPEGADLVRQLAAKADVLVENFKVGDLARYGLDFESLSSLNPKLIYASITGFGQTGPRRHEPGYDAAMQAMTGIMSVTGEADGGPSKVGVAWIDIMTGWVCSTAILAALHSGKGQHLDISLFDVGLSALANVGQSALCTGNDPKRFGNAHPQIVPYQTFLCADGHVMICVGNDAQFAALCGQFDDPQATELAQFKTNAERVAHREQVVELVQSLISELSREDVIRKLKFAGVPGGAIQSIPEALADPQSIARGSVVNIGGLKLLQSPLVHHVPASELNQSRPPKLGEHTIEILESVLEMPKEVVASLLDRKVVR